MIGVGENEYLDEYEVVMSEKGVEYKRSDELVEVEFNFSRSDLSPHMELLHKGRQPGHSDLGTPPTQQKLQADYYRQMSSLEYVRQSKAEKEERNQVATQNLAMQFRKTSTDMVLDDMLYSVQSQLSVEKPNRPYLRSRLRSFASFHYFYLFTKIILN